MNNVTEVEVVAIITKVSKVFNMVDRRLKLVSIYFVLGFSSLKFVTVSLGFYFRITFIFLCNLSSSFVSDSKGADGYNLPVQYFISEKMVFVLPIQIFYDRILLVSGKLFVSEFLDSAAFRFLHTAAL